MFIIVLLLIPGVVWPFPGNAAEQRIILGTGRAPFNKAQQLILEADGKAATRDYKDAENLYSQVIAMDGDNIDAYLQRGLVRREMGNAAGTAADGRMAVALADAALKNRPNDPTLYYKRGMGFRLLKNFGQAEQDIATGIRLGGSSNWKTDLEAIALEQKENQ